jgi:hypothetical protein
MATVTKTIGTSSRNYSTITAWESDLNDAAIYSSSDDAVGECYKDSTFSENVTLRGTLTDLNSATLTVAADNKHTGTAGTGAILSGYIRVTESTSGALIWNIKWLEVTGNSDYSGAKIHAEDSIDSTKGPLYIENMLIYNADITENGTAGAGIRIGEMNGHIANCFIYDISHTNTGGDNIFGINKLLRGTYYVYNCSVQDIKKPGGTVAGTKAIGIGDDTYGGDKYLVGKNCLIGSLTGPTTSCLSSLHSSSDYNQSADSTASGSNSLTGKSAANQFVSTTTGSENLHLIESADAVDAGVDLGTTANTDIDNKDRNATDITWDIGADEWSLRSTTVTKKINSLGLDSQIAYLLIED